MVVSSEVWQQDFGDRLRIRFANHHSKCSQCIKHRLIIKRLGHCGPARRSQFEELQRHLNRQLADRRTYYFLRAQSRLNASSPFVGELCCILDSMDMQKYAWPKSKIMLAKEFATWARPRMACTSMLIHGHVAFTALTHHCLSTNSSRTAEILSAGMTFLSKMSRIDFSKIFLSLQADNASKEVKNNCMVRHLSMQIALGRLRGAQMCFLSSGHSHEDIDAMFSTIRNWLGRYAELLTPESFVQALDDFFQVPEHRSNEKFRSVILMSKFRDWQLPLTIYLMKLSDNVWSQAKTVMF